MAVGPDAADQEPRQGPYPNTMKRGSGGGGARDHLCYRRHTPFRTMLTGVAAQGRRIPAMWKAVSPLAPVMNVSRLAATARVAAFSTNSVVRQMSEASANEGVHKTELNASKVALSNGGTHPKQTVSKTSFTYTLDTLPPRQDPLLQFMVNLLMRDGKKATAERFVAGMLADMAKLTNSDPLPLVYEAVELAKPILRMQSRKQGGKTMQVPIPLNPRQSTRRAIMWIIEASRRRADRSISHRLAVEMLAVLEGNSSVLSRKDEAHKIGTVNRANASVRI